MSTTKVCHYDGCHPIESAVANKLYCSECGCKRKAENKVRRIDRPLVYDDGLWQAEEDRKRQLAQKVAEKNKWILDNKSFAVFDIESTNLDANFGEMLAACILPLNPDGEVKIYRDTKSDEKIVQEVRDELANYDYVVTYYGTGFDIPFLQTRLINYDLEPLREIRHVDMYYTARTVLKLHSNRLAVVSELLFGKNKKTNISFERWNRAMRGDEEAMDYIVEHCVKDVEVLRDVFYELVRFKNLSQTPLRLIG